MCKGIYALMQLHTNAYLGRNVMKDDDVNPIPSLMNDENDGWD